MDPTSVDPPLAAALGNFEDYDLRTDLLDDFMNGEDPEQFLTNSADLFDRIGFESDSIEQTMVTYPTPPSTLSPSSSNSSAGSLSPQSTSDYLVPSKQDYIEVKVQPTEIKIGTTTDSKRRSERQKRPTMKAQAKKPRLEKSEVFPKIEIIEDRETVCTPLPVAAQKEPVPISDVLLTSEEQEVLAQNGWEYSEKNIKKARRKIKNKISAQESRKRKRDYVSSLEERLSSTADENKMLKRDLEKERATNKSLMCQVRELRQAISKNFEGKNVKSATTQTSAAVMVVLLCMTVFKSPFSSTEEDDIAQSQLAEGFDYSTPSYKSRVLKCFSEDDMDFCSVEGKKVPVINFDSEDDEGDPTSLLQSQLARMKMDQSEPEYERGTLVNIARNLLSNQTQLNASEAIRNVEIPNLKS